jgi:lycopene cyclase domain-containing protein
MTYFGFLLQFIVVPIIILLVVHFVLNRLGRPVAPPALSGLPFVPVLLGHMLVALIYTTPWDNYLVASGVWTYDRDLVSGIVIGWVPIEEYTFFILQPIMVGLWLLLMARLLPIGLASTTFANPNIRIGSVAGLGIFWLFWVVMLVSGWAPATYMSLILSWALPPVLLQFAFGADILWRYRTLLFWALVPPVLYLSFADALAIGSGTWTIDPAQSFNVFIGGVLPVEEFVFFLMTSLLLVFGVTLVMAVESQRRLRDELLPWLNDRFKRGVADH